jgi:hypothetical protein
MKEEEGDEEKEEEYLFQLVLESIYIRRSNII